jgi:FG-GAP repeat protein
MRKFVVLGLFAALVLAMVSAPAGAKTNKRPSVGRAGQRVMYQSERGRRALAAARATGVSVAAAAGGTASVQGDFNDDGRQDLAIGVPSEDYGATNDGFVHVVYGSATGLTSAGNQGFGEPDLGILAINDEEFGAALAGGDFNGDGFEDLAVGIPGWDSGSVDSGAVVVLPGSAGGLLFTELFIDQDVPNVENTNEANDRFGASLAVANFGNGGRVDLAVGVPGEDASSGSVQVFYGTVAGLDTANDQFLSQNTSLVEDVSEAGDSFGTSLAAGNFGQSGQADLAIGAPLEDVGVAIDAGAVNVLFGSTSGLTSFNDQLWHQDRDGIKDVAEEADSFGQSLAAANFGKSSFADLAVGAYLEGFTGQADLAGAVHVIYGGSPGLVSAGNQFWSQNSPGITDKAEIIDFFGFSVAAANFGKSAQADLAIGAPLESLGAVNSPGAVHVLYGTSTGLKATGSQFWNQNSTGILGTNENGQIFGWALAAANYGKTSQADLAIGVPSDLVGAVTAGAVNVLYGTATGISQAGDQLWHQDSPGIFGVAEAGDSFGEALG